MLDTENLKSEIINLIASESKNYPNETPVIEALINQIIETDDLDEAIVKCYTEECFIFRTVNRILREENWSEIKKWHQFILSLMALPLKSQIKGFCTMGFN